MSREEVNLTALPRCSIRDVPGETDIAQGLRTALANSNPDACRFLAGRAGEKRDVSTVIFLSGILAPPGKLDARLLRRRWTGARLAAVDALGQIGAEHALPALAQACLDPEPAIQQAAAEILLEHGPDALPVLNAVLTQGGDWPLSGMKRLVEVIGSLQSPQAGKTLTSVVLAGLPTPPPRWDRPLLYSIRIAIGLVVTGTTAALAISGNPLVGISTLR